MNEFDELFNDFLNGGKSDNDNIFSEIYKKIINGETLTDSFINELGEPTDITTYVEDDKNVEKRTWVSSDGEISVYKYLDTPLSLQEQLNKAIEIEDYELADKLHKEINKKID